MKLLVVREHDFRKTSAGCMPTAFVEAMVSGLAFVASNIDEIAEIAQPVLQNQLFDPYDENAMCNAAVELSFDSDKRVKCGETGRQWTVERYSIEKSTEQLCRQLPAPFFESGEQ